MRLNMLSYLCPHLSGAGGSTFSGDGTYYSADRGHGGICNLYNPIPQPQTPLVVAINAPQYSTAALCGACVHVTGPNGEVTARVVNVCPECAFGSLDLSQEAFVLIADQVAGRVAIRWSVVRCPEEFVQGPVELVFKDGSTQYWFAIQVSPECWHACIIKTIVWSCV